MSPRLLLPLCYLAVTTVLVAFFLRPPEGAEAVAGPRTGPARGGAAQPVSAANENAAAEGTVAPATAPSRSEVARLSGTLRVAGEGEPLSCVRVRLDPGPATETDTDGGFALAGLAPGEVRVRVEAGEGFDALDLPLELGPGDNHVVLELAPRFDLGVLVVRQARRGEAKPIAGARVLLRAPDPDGVVHGSELLAEAVSDESGRCDLRDLPGGTHELLVEAPGMQPSRLVLPFLHRERRTAAHLRSGSITVALARPGLVLRGRVLGPARAPVAGALVCLDDPLRGRTPGRTIVRGPRLAVPFTFSDATGSFELPLPEDADQVALLACTTQDGLSPIARAEVAYEHLGRPVSVLVPAAAEVDLRVLDADGQVLRGCLQVSDGVLAYDLLSDPLLTALPGVEATFAPTTGEDGTLRLRLPSGGYHVRFEGDEPGTLGAWFVQVDGAAARTLELRLPAPSGEPSGGGL